MSDDKKVCGEHYKVVELPELLKLLYPEQATQNSLQQATQSSSPGKEVPEPYGCVLKQDYYSQIKCPPGWDKKPTFWDTYKYWCSRPGKATKEETQCSKNFSLVKFDTWETDITESGLVSQFLCEDKDKQSNICIKSGFEVHGHTHNIDGREVWICSPRDSEEKKDPPKK